jgi:CheY-like chemotaxis protein
MAVERSSKIILVIDDSTTNVVLLQAVLNGKGYTIETALSVKDAFMIIAKTKPDLILLDLLMPRINGFDFLKEIKASENNRDIPVIVVSALTDQENIHKSIALGAIDFIKKPVDIQNLVDLVEKVFNRK